MPIVEKIHGGAGNSFYTAIIENSPDCLKILDDTGRLQFMNVNGRCLMEIEDFDAIKGKHWWDMWGETERTTVMDCFQHAVEGTPQQFIAKCATAKGNIKWWDVLISPATTDENGRVQILSISRDITERKEQEDAVRRMASHLKLATESANVGTWRLDMQTLALDWSPLHKKMWGYDENRTDLLYEDWHSLILPDDKEKAFGKVEEARINHSFYEVEYRIARADDKAIRWIKSSGLYYYSPSGEALTLTGVSIDITQQKESEQALAYRKALLEAQNEAVPDGFLIVDTKGKMLSYNKSFATIWGIPDEITERKDDTAALQVAMTKVKDPDAFIQKVNYYYNNPGEKAWDELHFIDGRIIERHGNRVVGESGEVYGWAWYFRDITNRKKTELEIKASGERFRLLADIMPQQIWTSDENGNLNYFNRAVYEYTGLTDEKIQNDGWIQIVHPDDREENIRKWVEAVTTGEDFFMEHRFRKQCGEYRWQLSRAKPHKNSEGKILMWVGTSTDIHEQKIKEQQKDEFISIASHEMKTPLTTAKGYLELLLLALEDNETPHLYATKASQAVQRLHTFVTELLDASKIQNGQLHYNAAPFIFTDLLHETIDNIQHSTKTHRIILEEDFTGMVTGDRNRLMQVLVNLLTNAIKYSPSADTVLVKAAEKDQALIVTVTDYGIGMAREHLDKIFDRYYRVQEQAVFFQGLGIGLYLSYNIVQRHGGTMWAESEEGKGSTFYFSLPLGNNSGC